MIPISETEILQRLHFDNAWWDSSKIEERYQSHKPRDFYESFCKLITDKSINRAVILMGPRRVGKTVMVHHSIEHLLNKDIEPSKILYLSLETPIYTGLSLEAIVLKFLRHHGHERNDDLYIFFDEIQYHRQWEVHLKSLVDSYPSFRFIATGSAAAALNLQSKESGAGRFTDFMLPPLTFQEYIKFTNPDSVFNNFQKKIDATWMPSDITELNDSFVQYLNYGGYPEAVFSETVRENPDRFIKSDIIDKVLQKDLPSLYGIDDTQELNKLFAMLAYNTGQEISLEGLSQNSGIAKNTLKKYIQYLEAAFLLQVIHRVDQNSKKFKRAVKFKVYLTNLSMRAALFGPIHQESELMGAITETAIYAQLFHDVLSKSIHYARWKDGEVDMVYLSASKQEAERCIEIKWSDLHYSDSRKLSSLQQFISTNSSCRSVFITTKTIFDFSRHIDYEQNGVIHKKSVIFVPSSLYAIWCGCNIEQSLDLYQKKNSHTVSSKP